ncbi:DUF3466 family protein [Vibrio sp. SS-MA-C1-2]|uniref:DUF3466 family protein n=1 Tax=Vibrio sp. SS-MA-C1-2 TaxID=2908646 RepID=UPI001F166874|nr:DUF3466 family protein [Vibrio sp. SS-MA-C1-2]UJF18092.1 DUF3466 family protein [Vibrio sp. SS-MA-C1-2]
MKKNIFKLSALTVLVAGALPAQAALYKVVEVNPSSSDTSINTYGQGIGPSAISTSCFADGANCGDADDTSVVGQTLSADPGMDLQDTFPFLYDFDYTINSESDFRSVCYTLHDWDSDLCDDWANRKYYGVLDNGNAADSGDFDDGTATIGGYVKYYQAWVNGYQSLGNALLDSDISISPFANGSAVDGNNPTGVAITNSNESILNATNGTYSVGTGSSAYFDSGSVNARAFAKRGFVTDSDGAVISELLPDQAATDGTNITGQSTANTVVNDGTDTYVFGSASVTLFDTTDGDKLDSNDSDRGINIQDGSNLSYCLGATTGSVYAYQACQYLGFANQAAGWKIAGSSNTLTPFFIADNWGTNGSITGNRDEASPQAAILGANTSLNLVGYSTYDWDDLDGDDGDRFRAFATYYTYSGDGSTDSWSSTRIPMDVESDGDLKYNFSVANDINEDNVIVGSAQYYLRESRAIPEVSYIYKAEDSSVTYFNNIDSSIFFDGSSSVAKAINNRDQVVGWVDVDTNAEVDGKSRRQRGYILRADSLYNIDDGDSSAFGDKKVYMLDDLTNGTGAESDANDFRIAQATDINDAGVISASALKCEGGYSDTYSDSTCSTTETVVAVKLIPISDSGNRDIEPRGKSPQTTERSGASLGWLGLISLMGLFGFRRRIK